MASWDMASLNPRAKGGNQARRGTAHELDERISHDALQIFFAGETDADFARLGKLGR